MIVEVFGSLPQIVLGSLPQGVFVNVLLSAVLAEVVVLALWSFLLMTVSTYQHVCPLAAKQLHARERL